jgi:hypothetical protein
MASGATAQRMRLCWFPATSWRGTSAARGRTLVIFNDEHDWQI